MDSFFDGNFRIEVATASGIEAATKRELTRLGYNPSGAIFGRICFDGTLKDVARANMFLRTANRVRIVLGRFEAHTFDELFCGVKSINWQEICPPDAQIIVNAKSSSSALFALRSIQSISKKAIVAKMQAAGIKILSEDGARYDIEVSIVSDIVAVTLDTSGEGLHKRGYRTYLGDAPIRETLAAAMIEMSVFNADRPLIDPFCGSGTIPIEAALISLNIAPGLKRSFAFENFANGEEALAEAKQEAKDIISDKKLRISGFDINENAIKLALKHAALAGVKDKIHFQCMDMRDVQSHYAHGVIITNPPYGERLMSADELKLLYADFGKMTRSLDEWCVYVITSFRGFEKYYGKRADRVRRLYNSELECNFYQYLASPPPKMGEKTGENK